MGQGCAGGRKTIGQGRSSVEETPSHRNTVMARPDIGNAVNTIGNDLNYHKYIKLITETCTKVMNIASKLLYNWPDGKLHKLADHLDEIPINQQLPLKQLLTHGEIEKIQEMRVNKDAMKGYDIFFFYKLIKYAINNDRMKSSNDSIWTKDCPHNLKDELEYLLFLLKNRRNEFNYGDGKFFDLNDDNIKQICDTLCQRFRSIMEQIGSRTDIDLSTIDEICCELKTDVEKIQNMKEFSLDEKERLLKFTIQNDFMPYLEEAQPLLETELEKYCPPTLNFEGEMITPEELLSRDYQLICINAEATAGKTSLSKYIQHKLLSEFQIQDVDLTSLEIPLRVICSDITKENFFREFLKEMIPIFRYHVSDDQDYHHIRNFLKHFNIRWIIDGYDEKEDEWFSGFFKTLLNVLSNNHKIIITSRPDNLAELRDEADKLDYRGICSVTIECFSVEQIKDFVVKYFGNEVDKVQDFHHSMEKLNPSLREYLETPDELLAYLEFWSNHPSIYDGSIMTTQKFNFVNTERYRNIRKDHGGNL